MNFVTFNQDYSYLAVGKRPFGTLQAHAHALRLCIPSISDLEGFSHIHDGPFREEL